MTESPNKPAFISTQVRSGRYLFLDLKPQSGAGLTVVCAGREECAPEYRIARHSFRYHALEYVVSGRWELDVGSQRSVLGPGALFAYGPGVDYTLAAAGTKGLVKFFVDFAGRAAPLMLRRSGLIKGQTLQVQQTRWIHDLFDQILDCANLSRKRARVIGSKLTELLLIRLREDIRFGKHLQSESHRSYARCRELMQEHFRTLNSVAEVAARCHLDAAYLSRLFRRHAGENPLQFLTRLKMDQAAELILRRGLQVKQAAAEVGFEDPYHFSRVFKRVHGVAPGKFSRS